MRPSLALLSKASRLPLNSKQANKDFYKGTRTGNIMVRKRLPVANRNTGEQLYNGLGQPRTWNVKTARIDEARVPSYIVPPGIAQCKLEPLVWLGKKSEGGVDMRPDPGYPGGPKMVEGGGLNADIYKELRGDILERRLVAEDRKENLSRARTATSNS